MLIRGIKMSKIIKLEMVFDDESTAPDLGDITFDRDRNLMLTHTSKALLQNLTYSICGAVFNIPAGTHAVVLDTGEVFEYIPDKWYRISDANTSEHKYGTLNISIEKDGAGYALGDDEKIVFSILNNGQAVITKNITQKHYQGNGLYCYWINIEDAHTLHDLGDDYTISAAVYSGETDITNTFTIKQTRAREWYDANVKYDTGVM